MRLSEYHVRLCLCKHVAFTGAVLLIKQVKQLRSLFQESHLEVESPNTLSDALLGLVATEMVALTRRQISVLQQVLPSLGPRWPKSIPASNIFGVFGGAGPGVWSSSQRLESLTGIFTTTVASIKGAKYDDFLCLLFVM